MRKEQAGSHDANRMHEEHKHCERVGTIHQAIHTSGLDKFTYSRVHSLWKDLNDILHTLERSPEEAFRELIEVIDGLREARDELRLARFLFDVEEINPVHRLIMRNRAISRGKARLYKVLRVWPLQSAAQRLQAIAG